MSQMSRLFGTSGVRGVVNEEFEPRMALDLGLALATQLGNSGKVVVGRDSRTSGPLFESCLISGLLSGGCDVVKLGIVPTPVVSFAVRFLGATAGVMVTASHNPPEYNGVKFYDSSGKAYSGEAEEEVEDIFRRSTRRARWRDIGRVSSVNVLPDYVERIVNSVSLTREFKVVVDCANGAGALVTPQLLRRLGCKVVTLNSHLSGFFPGHLPEPTADNLRDLCATVRSIGADLGLAHDGDADRIAAVDERGRMVEWDRLLALASAHAVRESGRKVVTTVDASRVVDEFVTAAGGELIRTKVGDVNVLRAMEEHGSTFGGEPSGSWIWADINPCPDGPLSGVRILELLDRAGVPFSKLVDEVPSYPVVRAKVECRNEEKERVMKAVEERFRHVFGDVREVLTVDGVRLTLEDGSWVLIRPSGTESYIRITAEADDEKRAESLTEMAGELIRQSREVIKIKG